MRGEPPAQPSQRHQDQPDIAVCHKPIPRAADRCIKYPSPPPPPRADKHSPKQLKYQVLDVQSQPQAALSSPG